MPNIIIKLRELSNTSNHNNQAIATYILNNIEEVTNSSIHELAHKTYTSPSSIVRLCKAIGFTGYRDFRHQLTLDLNLLLKQENTNRTLNINKDDTAQDIIDKVTSCNIISLQDTKKLTNAEDIVAVVRLIHDANNILLFGTGSSYNVSCDLQLKLMRINKPCFLQAQHDSQLLNAKNASSKDLAIFISYSGKTKEILECLDIVKKQGCTCIAITRFATSELAKKSDICLYTAANENLFRNGAIASTIAQLNIIDIIYTYYITTNYDSSLKQVINTHIEKS